jgi:hypothetical protein
MPELPPVTPILNNTSKDLLEDVESVLWHLVRFSLENPGETSTLFETELVSFRKIEAQHENDREGTAEAYAEALRNAVAQYYPNEGIGVNIETEDRDDISYAVQILITDASGEPLLTFNPVIVNLEGDSIDIDFAQINR